jgi:uncharacterized membrane protein
MMPLWQLSRQYTSNALWVIPFGAIILELVLYRLLRALDAMLGWQILGFTASGGQAMLQTVSTMTLSFIVFTFGSLLVAIQVASGQLTPRVIATTLLRDNVVRYTVGLFVFSLLFAISVLNRIEGTGDQLVLVVAGVLGLLSMAAFLYLIDYAARLLRPISILSRVGENGLTVIAAVYPQPIQGPSVVRRLRAMIESLIRGSSRRPSGPAGSARSHNQGYIRSSGGIGSRTGIRFTGPRRDTDLK